MFTTYKERIAQWWRVLRFRHHRMIETIKIIFGVSFAIAVTAAYSYMGGKVAPAWGVGSLLGAFLSAFYAAVVFYAARSQQPHDCMEPFEDASLMISDLLRAFVAAGLALSCTFLMGIGAMIGCVPHGIAYTCVALLSTICAVIVGTPTVLFVYICFLRIRRWYRHKHTAI